MTPAVDVSVLNAKVRCTPDGQATHVFTLINRSAAGLTVDVSVQADAGTASGWFTLVGSPQRTLGARGAEQVIVRTCLPAGIVVGVYTFQLVVRATQGAGERIGVSPRAAVQLDAALAAPASTHPAGMSRWRGWSVVWPSWLRRCFVMPSFAPPALAFPGPPSSGIEPPGWLVKGLLGLFILLFVVALGVSLAAAVQPTEDVELVDGPPDHWITDLAVWLGPTCERSDSHTTAEATQKRQAETECIEKEEVHKREIACSTKAENERDECKKTMKRECEAGIKIAVITSSGCVGKHEDYWK